eukprot:248063-Rhodomonas_salina.1
MQDAEHLSRCVLGTRVESLVQDTHCDRDHVQAKERGHERAARRKGRGRMGEGGGWGKKDEEREREDGRRGEEGR